MTLFSYYFFTLLTTTTTTVGRVSKANQCSKAAIYISNVNMMRMSHWIHRLASFSNSKINNVNGKSHYHQQQTSRHTDRHKRRTKHVATNMISSNPSTDNNKQSYVNSFILLSLLDEIDDSPYHANFFNIFAILTMIFRAAHSPQSAVFIEINHWFYSWYIIYFILSIKQNNSTVYWWQEATFSIIVNDAILMLKTLQFLTATGNKTHFRYYIGHF